MGELARKPGCPELPSTPLEQLTNRPGEGFTQFQKWAWPVAGGGSGAGYWILKNYLNARPLWSGIQYTILFGAISAYVFTKIRDIRFAGKAENDAIYRHYITLHPEDFPPYERKRIRDIYVPFIPLR